MMPAKYDRYIEVFGGGGWVLFGKEPDKGVMEVFNDYNADLINLYRCVKTGHGSFAGVGVFAAEQPG